MKNNDIGFIYKEAITEQELERLQEDYFVFSNTKIANNEYDFVKSKVKNDTRKNAIF